MSRELLKAEGLGKHFPVYLGKHLTFARKVAGLGAPRERMYVFQNVNLSVRAGECLGLVGGNGTGKSTLLRCLAGVVRPNEGRVLPVGRLVAVLAHGYGAYEEQGVNRNIVLTQQLLGASLADANRNVESVAALAGLADRVFGPTSQLSEGMRAKLALASLAHVQFDIALLDECLNHVDTEFRQLFHGLTRKWIAEGRALILTSHDDSLLTHFATRLVTIENKTLTAARAPG